MRTRHLPAIAPSTAPKEKLAWVDAGKGLSILLVVMTHSEYWLAFAGAQAGPVMAAINDAAVPVRMPLFFLLAGMLASKWAAAPWRSLFNAKFALLLWAFLLWQPVVFGYKYLSSEILPDQVQSGPMPHIVRMVVSPVRPNAELWFIWALVIFLIAAKIVHKWPSRLSLGLAVVASIVWSGVVRDQAPDAFMVALGPGLGKVPMYFLFFLAGSVLSWHIKAVVNRVGMIAALAGAAVWVVVYVVLGFTMPTVLGTFADQVIGVCAGLCFSVALAKVKPLRELGKQTLPVYLVHTTVIVLLACGLHLVPWTLHGLSGNLAPWAAVAIAVYAGLLLNRVAGSTFLFKHPQWVLIRDARPSVSGSFRLISLLKAPAK